MRRADLVVYFLKRSISLFCCCVVSFFSLERYVLFRIANIKELLEWNLLCIFLSSLLRWHPVKARCCLFWLTHRDRAAEGGAHPCWWALCASLADTASAALRDLRGSSLLAGRPTLNEEPAPFLAVKKVCCSVLWPISPQSNILCLP